MDVGCRIGLLYFLSVYLPRRGKPIYKKRRSFHPYRPALVFLKLFRWSICIKYAHGNRNQPFWVVGFLVARRLNYDHTAPLMFFGAFLARASSTQTDTRRHIPRRWPFWTSRSCFTVIIRRKERNKTQTKIFDAAILKKIKRRFGFCASVINHFISLFSPFSHHVQNKPRYNYVKIIRIKNI